MAKYQDDQFDHLVSDIDKMRVRFRQYISYSGSRGARSVADEIIMNSLDEARSPKSPGNRILIEFDERDGFLMVEDNGRGIPTNILEEVYTSLNMGSNIYTSKKANLKAETLGQNGTGTLAICALAELVEITSYRGGTENIARTLVFEEGKKVDDRTEKCQAEKHGMRIRYKPSKVMGKDTRIIWEDIHQELLDLQFLLRKKINISSRYTDMKGNVTEEKYKILPFEDILMRNPKESFISQRHSITVDADNVIEEIDGQNIKRYVSMDLAFGYVTSPAPYIDSFSNSVHTVDAGDHLDAAMEAVCRFLQNQVKATMSDKEKEKLDIRWDDVRSGLTLCVALRTNFERMYTGQTKHKVVSAELKRVLIQLVNEALGMFFAGKNQPALKELINVVKMNARARREADKVKSAVVKNALTDWSGYKIKNFDPCTAKGTKEYKELFIIEGDSAKGSLKKARDPRFQALFAIRGVSANVFKMAMDQIVGPKGNVEFTNLVRVMGCNVGPRFDRNLLNYNKIIIASDADKLSMSTLNFSNCGEFLRALNTLYCEKLRWIVTVSEIG